MDSPLARIATLAASLKEAELRTLLEIVRRANEHHQCRESSRQIAEATGLSRPNVQAAIDSLCNRGLITSDGGSATRAATYTLQFLATEVLPVRGSIAEPPPCEKHAENSQQVALFQSQGGTVTEPPVASQQSQGWLHSRATTNKERARAGVGIGIDFDIEKALDRLRQATPALYDQREFAEAKRWLHGCMAKFGALPDPHPPDDRVVAQFLAIAEWPRLLGMIYDLMAEPETRRTKPAKYGWFVVVAMQRMWGLTPQQQRAARERLQLVKQEARQQTGEIESAIAATAARKRMTFSR